MSLIQRLKEQKRRTSSQGSSHQKRVSIRPLSQSYAPTKASQASQTAKYEPLSPDPSEQPNRSEGVKDLWVPVRDELMRDIEYKNEPTQDLSSPDRSTEFNTSASQPSTNFPHSTPDTDVDMKLFESNSFDGSMIQPYLAASPLEWNLPQKFTHVAYSRHHQERLDQCGIAWGVQWEIARIAMLPEVGWDSIPLGEIENLCGSHVEQAPRVLDTLLCGHSHYRTLIARERTIRPPSYSSPWAEYDQEEPSIREDMNHRDGWTARLGGESSYFGGKVDQIVRLTLEKGKFKFTLQPPMKSKSFRFRRFTGSRRLLDVRFSKEEPGLRAADVLKFFVEEALVINGRVFRAFYAREGAVHLLETNEERFRPASRLLGDHNRMSLQDFIQWHNPLYANPNQPVPKWASRFALGFSDSQPGISFAPANIHFIDDIVAPGQTSNSAIMTDGAGYINLAALYLLMEKMKWSSVPVCVQGRFAGSKGLYIMHPSDRNRDDEPRIYIRPSQIKVKLHPDPSRWCPSQRILDVLIRAPLSTGITITDQIIMNLAHNGVGTDVLDELVRTRIESVNFIHLMHPDRLPQLWDSIYSLGKVQEYKLKGLTPVALARAQGLADLQGESEMHQLSSVKFSYQNDPSSGMPPNYETQALGLLQAGFDATFFPLFKRIEAIQKQVLFGLDEKCHLRINDSALTFVIPDPLNILEEGEIFCGFGNKILDQEQEVHCITGPVLVTRNPCILPSDVRKVMAVECPQLWTAQYHDVIVFSTKGKSSLASMLGGGDYDGDTVIMIWDHKIVDTFSNSATGYADVDVSDSFDMRRGLVKDVAPNDHESVINALLAPLMPTQVGMYGNWHVQAAKLCGLDHPETVRLGNVFTTCLDGQKTGLTPRRSVLGADSARWNQVDCRLPKKFTVIEDLKDALDEHRKKCESDMGQLRPPSRHDPQLLAPYREAHEMSQRIGGLKEELNTIVAFVDEMRRESKSGAYAVDKRHGRARFSRPQGGKMHSTGERQESERAVSEAYKREMPRGFEYIWECNVPQIAASYAYSKDYPEEPKFSFMVAWDTLCEIKARAQGRPLTMDSRFGSIMSISRRMRQQLDLIND